MALLTHQAYLATMGETRTRVPVDEPAPFNYSPYFDAILIADFGGHDCSGGTISYVWREGSDRFEHILVNSEDKNVFMVLVLDGWQDRVYGHRLLDLNKEYGLRA